MSVDNRNGVPRTALFEENSHQKGVKTSPNNNIKGNPKDRQRPESVQNQNGRANHENKKHWQRLQLHA